MIPDVRCATRCTPGRGQTAAQRRHIQCTDRNRIPLCWRDAHHLVQGGLHLSDSAFELFLNPHVALLQEPLRPCLQHPASVSEYRESEALYLMVRGRPGNGLKRTHHWPMLPLASSGSEDCRVIGRASQSRSPCNVCIREAGTRYGIRSTWRSSCAAASAAARA